MFYGPLSAARKIIKARSAHGLPLPPLIFQLLSSIVWAIWAIYLSQPPIAIPNGLGVIFSIAQISLWIWATKQEKSRNGEPRNQDTDIELEPIAANSNKKVTDPTAQVIGI